MTSAPSLHGPHADPGPTELTTEYVLLGLRFDRLEEGFVDAYTGDARLRRQVAAEPPPDPAALARRARELLADLPSSGLPADRAEFLRAQLTGLECSARMFAGEDVGFVEEVEAYFGVRIEPGDPDEYAAAHDALSGLLPGTGSVAERLQAHRRHDECPPDRLEEAVLTFSSALRDVVRRDYALDPAETVDYDVVTDKPWSGFNYYLGGYRSKVAINADLPQRLMQLPHLVAHESYPGHHTEHCRKEAGLVTRDRHLEHTIFLVNTPECLMAEGLADLGVAAAIGPGWGSWAQEIVADLGYSIDGVLAEKVSTAAAGLARVRQDAALLLHDQGKDSDEVVAFLQRWGLFSAERARQSLRFLSHPLWRAYTSTYIEGYSLLSRWLDARPAGQSGTERFGRLLDEPLTPRRIMMELGA